MERMRRTHSNGFHPLQMDPRRELQESLPLCHPHDDYLKDFQPMSRKLTLGTVTIILFSEIRPAFHDNFRFLPFTVQDDNQHPRPSTSKEGVLTWV